MMVVETQKTRPEADKSARTSGGGDADNVALNAVRDAQDADGSGNESVASTHSTTSSDASAPSDRRRGPKGEEDVASRTVHIQNKRFYIDVKQNLRGQFIKIAEVLPDGRKSRLSLSLRSTRELRNHLTQFSEFYASLGPAPINSSSTASAAESSPESQNGRTPPLKAAVIYANHGGRAIGKRRYFLDLKENRRGRFLQISEAASRNGFVQRYRIAIPAQGLIELRDNLTEVLAEFWPEAEAGDADDGNASALSERDLPMAKSMRIHPGKVFYFDPGCNPRGSFLRISQVTTRFRTSILLPKESLSKFRTMLDDVIKEFGSKASTGTDDKAKTEPGRSGSDTHRGGARSKNAPKAASTPKPISKATHVKG